MGGVARAVMPRPPRPPAPVYVAPTVAEVSQAQSTALDTKIKRGKGRSSTILTGAKGLGDNALTTSKQTLLGG
jgi:hypothetical protein|tara:strand:+ start:252 stop:470 length:219 start_codon:yes stop_codon:yes gene_type:complete